MTIRDSLLLPMTICDNLFLISGCIQLNHRTGMTFQMSEFAANGCVEAAVEWQSQPGHFLDLS